MPKLLALLPCEVVIISEDNTTSLITVMESINVSVPETEKLPAETLIPKTWAVYSLWLRNPEEAQKVFNQKLQFIHPTGKEVTMAVVPFTFLEGVSRHRVIVRVGGLPLVSAGTYVIRASIAAEGSEDWQNVTEFPIEFTRNVPAVGVA